MRSIEKVAKDAGAIEFKEGFVAIINECIQLLLPGASTFEAPCISRLTSGARGK